MNRFKLRVIQIISFVLVIFPILTVSTFQAVGIARNTFTNYIINDTGMYIDDFDANTFEDPTSDVFGWGLGTLTNERNFSWTPLDFYPTYNVIRDIAVQGRKAYAVGFNMTDYLQSILAFDINDPSDISLMSYRDSLSGITACDIDGDTLYTGVFESVYTPNNYLAPYNVCLPYNLNGGGIYLGPLSANGPVTDVEAVGHLVYYTAYNDSADQSFRIAEVSDPDNPKAINPNWVNNKSLGLAISGHFAYIAASDDGMYILNITDKYSPAEVGHIGLPGNATDVLVEGRFAYVTLGNGGFAVVDVFNPTNPVLINHVDTPGITNHMALQGNTFFVTDGPLGVSVYDVADPFNPSLVTDIGLPYTWDVELYGGVLVVGTDEGIHTFQISAEGGGITDFSRFYYENTFGMLPVWDVRVVGDIAYVAAGPDGFYTLNVRDPANPILLDHEAILNIEYRKIDVQGQHAVLSSPNEIAIFEISDPTNLRLLHISTGGNLGDVQMYGEMVYISWMAGGYGTLNVTTPEQLDLVTYNIAEPNFGTNITSVQAQGYHVYAVDNLGGVGVGLYVFEQIDLHNHLQIGSRTFTARNLDLRVDGDLAYHSDTDWCVITNVSDPYNSFYEGDVRDSFGSFITSTGVWNFGPYIISTSPTATYLVDTTDFINFESTEYNNTGGALAVTSSGDYTYVANHSNLIILRHFESAADTYIPGNNLAQSTTVFTILNGSIDSATLVVEDYVPDQTGIEYFITANGVNWEPVTPNIEHNFINPGTDLRWQAVFTGQKDRSAHLYQIEITFDFTIEGGGIDFSDPLWIGIFAGGGGLILIIIIVVIVVAVRKSKKVPSR